MLPSNINWIWNTDNQITKDYLVDVLHLLSDEWILESRLFFSPSVSLTNCSLLGHWKLSTGYLVCAVVSLVWCLLYSSAHYRKWQPVLFPAGSSVWGNRFHPAAPSPNLFIQISHSLVLHILTYPWLSVLVPGLINKRRIICSWMFQLCPLPLLPFFPQHPAVPRNVIAWVEQIIVLDCKDFLLKLAVVSHFLPQFSFSPATFHVSSKQHPVPQQ